MDSRIDTYEHIGKVREYLHRAISSLLHRALVHDASKLVSPEVEAFDEFTPKLRDTTYGSPEYKANLDAMRPAIDHHQKNNSHHPEFYENGIRGMTLIDLVEMFCDWNAATLRHKDGDIVRSIHINQERFGYSDDLKQILLNTVRELETK